MKIKYIATWFYTAPDKYGNTYNYFRLTSTRSGKSITGRDCPESNLTGAIYELNGDKWVDNYYFTKSQITWREYKWRMKEVPYIGCGAKEVAQAFRKVIRARKKSVVK